MSRINSFERFSKVYESEGASPEELINKAKEEMPLEVVADDAAQLIDPNKSDIVDRMKQAQAEMDEKPQAKMDETPVTIKENYTSGEELIKPEVMDSIMKSAMAKLPALTPGSKVWQRGRQVTIAGDAHFLPETFGSGPSGYTVYYKDKNRIYQDVYLSFFSSKEEIQHLKNIFDDLAQKSKWKNFVDKTVTIAGPTLALMGFGLFLFGMFRYQYNLSGDDAWMGSGGGGEGSGGGFSWEKVAPIGGYEVATGGGLFVSGALLLGLSKATQNQVEAIDGAISKLVSVLKAHLEPLNMKLTDLKTAADISAILNNTPPTGGAVAVETGNVLAAKTVESKTTKFGNLKRF